MVPTQRTVTEYQERRYMETIPREVVTVDYQAIEHIKQYVPQIIPERSVETYPVERIVQRTEYIPVERYTHSLTQANHPLPSTTGSGDCPDHRRRAASYDHDICATRHYDLRATRCQHHDRD
jgi:hypothetical protein